MKSNSAALRIEFATQTSKQKNFQTKMILCSRFVLIYVPQKNYSVKNLYRTSFPLSLQKELLVGSSFGPFLSRKGQKKAD